MEKENKKRKTFDLRLTKIELMHLRDLFGIALPNDMSRTVSSSLAEAADRIASENFLWNKIANLCEKAEIPLGEDAPDYIVAPAGSPVLSVFQVASEPEIVEEI